MRQYFRFRRDNNLIKLIDYFIEYQNISQLIDV